MGTRCVRQVRAVEHVIQDVMGVRIELVVTDHFAVHQQQPAAHAVGAAFLARIEAEDPVEKPIKVAVRGMGY